MTRKKRRNWLVLVLRVLVWPWVAAVGTIIKRKLAYV
jgi:hypothetical protein